MAADTDLKHLTNEQLLLRYQDTDAAAFDEFYRRNSALVFNFLIYRMRNRQAAEEVLQETFFKIHRSILSYNPAHPALAWVMAIAKNAAIDHLRKNMRTFDPADTEMSEPSTAEAVVSARQGLERILRQLGPDEREILISRLFNEESYDEIAARMSTSTLSLRKRMSRLLQKVSFQLTKL